MLQAMTGAEDLQVEVCEKVETIPSVKPQKRPHPEPLESAA